MNKLLIYISSIVFVLLLQSCNKYNDEPVPTLNVEWEITDRVLKTNDKDLDNSVNTMFKLDAAKYIIKKIYIKNREIDNVGTFEQLSISRETGSEMRKRDGTYVLKGDSLFSKEDGLELRERYSVTNTSLMTKTKVTKKELDILIIEIGGDPNVIAADVVGELTFKGVR